MNFIDKIKELIKRKNNKKLSQLEVELENEAIGSEYTLDELKPMVKGVQEFMNTFRSDMKRRSREDRRCLAVEWIGGIFGFLVFWGLFIIFSHQIRFFQLLDEWGLSHTLVMLIYGAFIFGYAFLLASTFFWLSDKTGLHYLIEDWVVSFHKYKKFPRKKRRGVIRHIKKELDEITDQLYRLEWEADETEDEKLSDSVESLNQFISTLDTEADISSRSLIHQPEHASWKGFVLALEKTSNKLELKLKDIAKYHNKIQPLLKHAFNITSKALYLVIDYCDEREKGNN